jgi:hypothetical protein
MVQMTLVPIVVQSVAAILTWLELAFCIAVPFFSGVVVSLALTRSPFSDRTGIWREVTRGCVGMFRGPLTS